MSINISKQKRDDLLAKIQEIRTYIATAEQERTVFSFPHGCSAGLPRDAAVPPEPK